MDYSYRKGVEIQQGLGISKDKPSLLKDVKRKITVLIDDHGARNLEEFIIF